MRLRLAPALLLILIAAFVAACGGGTAAPTTAPMATTAPAATEAPGSTQAPATTDAPGSTEAPAGTEAATSTPEPSDVATTAPEPTAEPAATEPAASGNTDEGPTGQAALDLFIEASRAQLAQRAFRATISGQDATGAESTTILEVMPPDRFRMVAEGTEFIIVPDGTFIKESGGEWQESPMSMSGMMSQLLSQQSVEELIKESQPDDLKFEGVDTIDGRLMWIYSFTGQEDINGTMVDTTSRTWIGALDKLPYRVEATAKTGDETQTSSIIYEYDESIEIEAPEMSS